MFCANLLTFFYLVDFVQGVKESMEDLEMNPGGSWADICQYCEAADFIRIHILFAYGETSHDDEEKLRIIAYGLNSFAIDYDFVYSRRGPSSFVFDHEELFSIEVFDSYGYRRWYMFRYPMDEIFMDYMNTFGCYFRMKWAVRENKRLERMGQAPWQLLAE